MCILYACQAKFFSSLFILCQALSLTQSETSAPATRIIVTTTQKKEIKKTNPKIQNNDFAEVQNRYFVSYYIINIKLIRTHIKKNNLLSLFQILQCTP